MFTWAVKTRQSMFFSDTLFYAIGIYKKRIRQITFSETHVTPYKLFKEVDKFIEVTKDLELKF